MIRSLRPACRLGDIMINSRSFTSALSMRSAALGMSLRNVSSASMTNAHDCILAAPKTTRALSWWPFSRQAPPSSSSALEETKDAHDASLVPAPSPLEQAKSFGRKAGIGAAALFFVYGVSKIAVSASSFTLGLSMWHMGELGFYVGGLVSTGALVAGYSFTRRLTSLSPDELTAFLMKQISEDPAVLHRLGSGMKQGRFKAYAYASEQGAQRYFPGHSHIELMVRVTGKDATAMMSARALKTWRGHIDVRSLALDIDSGERLILAGGIDDVVFKGVVRLR